MEQARHLWLLVVALPLVMSACRHEKSHNIGDCSFRIHCSRTASGTSISQECQGANNFPVTLDLTIIDAVQHDPNPDVNLLSYVTTLKISGYWPQTNLSILESPIGLEKLYLVNNYIESIDGRPFYYLNNLELVDLSYNRLTNVDELFKFEMNPNKLTEVSLAANDIKEVSDTAFETLTSLVKLDLSFNYISNLNEEPFSNLTNLHILKLNNNRITNLNGALNKLYHLKELYIRGNTIQNIDPESLQIIDHLETFDVSFNKLDKIEPIMFSRHWKHMGSHSVCKINLSNNLITSVPNATSKGILRRAARNTLRNYVDVLTELFLSNNRINTVDYYAFNSLIKLIHLDLSRNEISEFVVDGNDLIFARYLNLSGNHLSSLSLNSFSRMQSLENLDLSHNFLVYFPEHPLFYTQSLQVLNMTDNHIKNVDRFDINNMFHTNGGILDLSNNSLSKLQIPPGRSVRLNYLILHSNNICNLSLIDLRYIDLRNTLDMSRNAIEELNNNSLLLPNNLMKLNLSCNHIRSVSPSAFKRVPHLKTLVLSHNELTSIEYGAFQGLTELLNLDLSFNAIIHLYSNTLMDLKSLSVLSLRHNGMVNLDYKTWYGHKDLLVYIDENNLSCEWLSTALNNFNNGIIKMRPTVLSATSFKHSIEGIPCTPAKSGKIIDVLYPSGGLDERLLMVNQKILETLREQTFYMKRYMYMDKNEKLNQNLPIPVVSKN